MGKHPRTRRLLFRLLPFEDEDTFTRSWGDFHEIVKQKAGQESAAAITDTTALANARSGGIEIKHVVNREAIGTN